MTWIVPAGPGAGARRAGLAVVVVAGITVYVAAVFLLTPSGVGEAEQMAR
ncbi:hypothetical protein ACFW9O_35095 [Streptomyces sp. NPDC059499]